MDRFVFQAGGGADAAYTHAVVTRAWLQAQRRARAARRDHHLDPGAPLQRRDRRCRRLQGRDADAGGGRLPVGRSAQGGRLEPHRRPDDQQPGRHGHLQPAHRRVGADRPRGWRPRLLRSRQLQRRHGQDPRAPSSASTPACSCCTRPSARPRAAAARPSAPMAARPSWRRSCRRPVVVEEGGRYRLDQRPAARAPARCASSGAMSHRW